MRQAGRFSGPGQPYHGLVVLRKKGKGYEWTGDFREVPDMLDVPMRRKKPTLWFVNSMSDLFGEDISFEFIAAVFAVMAVARWHVFQVLTKRSWRMRKFFEWLEERTAEYSQQFNKPWSMFDTCVYIALEYVDTKTRDELSNAEPVALPLTNVWLGVSVENADWIRRIDDLREVDAAVRFVSFEPLLGPLGEVDLTGIDWAIFGGESSYGARECNLGWIREGVGQCRKYGVRPFVKQLGRKPILPARLATKEERKKIFGGNGDGPIAMIDPQPLSLEDSKGGDIAEFPVDLQVREMPEVHHGC